MRKLILPTFVLVVLLLLALDAFACSCATKPTVLDQFEGAGLVVAVRVASVERANDEPVDSDDEDAADDDDEEEPDTERRSPVVSTAVIVAKVYKGNAKIGDSLKLANGSGADCALRFDEDDIGSELLLYLGSAGEGDKKAGDQIYRTSFCGRSGLLNDVGEDLAYLDNIGRLRGKTRISGKFEGWYGHADFRGADIKLRIEGKKKSLTAKTNDSGFFQIYDLPPGEYTVTIDIPFGWKINEYMLERTDTGIGWYDPRARVKLKNQVRILIRPGRHTDLDLRFQTDTAIKGRVNSPAGKPLRGVCVKAVSTELLEGDYRGHSTCTNENGEFAITDMAPGNYILVANDDGKVSASNPFGIMFYPGVSEFRHAGVIGVEAGKHITGRVIQVPDTVELLPVKGKLLYADGKPAAGISIKFLPDDAKRFDEMSEESDASGAFTFLLPKGAIGKIFGSMHTYIGEFENCDKLESLIREAGDDSSSISTNKVEVSSLAPSELIELTFPFPSCRKSKK